MSNKLGGGEVNVHAKSETFRQQHHFYLSVPKCIPMDELLKILLRFICHGSVAATVVVAAIVSITTIKQEDGMQQKNKNTHTHTYR